LRTTTIAAGRPAVQPDNRRVARGYPVRVP